MFQHLLVDIVIITFFVVPLYYGVIKKNLNVAFNWLMIAFLLLALGQAFHTYTDAQKFDELELKLK